MATVPQTTDLPKLWKEWPVFPGPPVFTGAGDRKPAVFDKSSPQIIVFRTDIDGDALARCHADLSPAEKSRAEDYTAIKPRQTYIVCRSILRRVLAYVTCCQPADLDFVYGPYGKPFLEDLQLPRFNISHSGELGAIAWTGGEEIGIDIERLDRVAEMEGIARRFFSALESDQFFACPADLKREAFFKTWTCKEAFIKAVGLGLTYGLDRFSVNVHPREPAALIASDEHGLENWQLSDFRVDEHLVGAIAIASRTRQTPTFWRWCPNESPELLQS